MQDINQRPLCHRAEDLVTYLYGEAGEADATDFRNHLRQCDACRSEFAIFNQVHESIGLWRNEALGASFNPAAMVSESTIDSTQFVQHERRLSALAALREFFTVSPLWLRSATAFAALLLCVLGVMVVMRPPRKPVEVVNNGSTPRVYTGEEVQNIVKDAVEKKVQEFTASKQNRAPETGAMKDKAAIRRSSMQLAVNQPHNSRSRLTRQEREQLAADLRLTSTADEEEMLLALPEQENPNQ